MPLDKYLANPTVRKYVRHINEGEYLFRQGERANTMFFLIGGIVALIAEDGDDEHTEGLLGAGEFLGEKALLSDTPYQRRFSARAVSECTVMEIAAKDIVVLQADCPQMIPDLFRATLEVTARRLDRANFLIRALRPADRLERFIAILGYYIRATGRKNGTCIEVELRPESVQHYIEMDAQEVERYFAELVRHNVLVKKQGHRYLVPSEGALAEFLRNVRAKIAA